MRRMFLDYLTGRRYVGAEMLNQAQPRLAKLLQTYRCIGNLSQDQQSCPIKPIWSPQTQVKLMIIVACQ